MGAYDLIRRAKPARLYLVAAPTYPMLSDATLRTFLDIGRTLGVVVADGIRKSPPSVRLTTGAEVLFRTADDPERLRGPNLSGAWLDEASLMQREARDVVIAALREGDERGGLSATFTPKGVAHWTYDYFGKPNRPDTSLFHAHTRDNPFLPAEFYETVARQYPSEMARQELAGEFLDTDEARQVIPTAWVRAAQARWRPDGHGDRPLDALGVDVARGGAAQTVLAPRHGRWLAPLQKVPGRQTPDGPSVAALVALARRVQPLALVLVDVIGVGASAYDHCRQLPGCRAYPVNFAAACAQTDSTGTLPMANLRAFAYWSLRELLDPARSAAEAVSLPPDPELLEDLTVPRWEMTVSGVKIEKKDDLAERLGRSPDCGDAVALACLLPPAGWLLGDQGMPERLGV